MSERIVPEAIDLALEAVANAYADLQREIEEERETRKRLSALLDGVALALRGPPGPLEAHSYADLPERAAEVMRQLTRLTKAEETLRSCGVVAVG